MFLELDAKFDESLHSAVTFWIFGLLGIASLTSHHHIFGSVWSCKIVNGWIVNKCSRGQLSNSIA